MTDKPFGVNLTFLPAFAAPPYPEYIDAIIEGGVKIVETAGRNPAGAPAGAEGSRHQGDPQVHLGAARAEGGAIGCDAVSVDGFECGGHPGEDDVPNMILLPRAAEELKIPFVASGGMADGRSLVAALALGADGMNMGTRFIATKEAPVHDNVKQALVEATELDTRLIMRPLRNTERVLNNAAVERILEIEHEKGAELEDRGHHRAGRRAIYPKVMEEGDMDAGAWTCGMVAGLIHDIPTVKELIDRIMAEAETHHPRAPDGPARGLEVVGGAALLRGRLRPAVVLVDERQVELELGLVRRPADRLHRASPSSATTRPVRRPLSST